jgi:hypothetical protein
MDKKPTKMAANCTVAMGIRGCCSANLPPSARIDVDPTPRKITEMIFANTMLPNIVGRDPWCRCEFIVASKNS